MEKSTFGNLKKGVKHRLHKATYRPFSKFNMSWWQEKFYKHAAKGKEYKFAYSPQISIRFTDPQAFILSIQELFVDEIYKFNCATDSPYILDCGAHIGMSILAYKQQYPKAKIIAFEPDPHNFSLATANVNSWSYANIEIINKAIWTHNDAITFHSTGDMGSNIIEAVPEATNNGNLVQMPCARLKDYLHEPIDFIKMDIEGAEYEVMKDCAGHFGNVQNLFVEYHGNYDEMYKLNEILNILTEEKFAWYIKEAGNVYSRPMYDKTKEAAYDVQLNIFAFRQ